LFVWLAKLKAEFMHPSWDGIEDSEEKIQADQKRPQKIDLPSAACCILACLRLDGQVWQINSYLPVLQSWADVR